MSDTNKVNTSREIIQWIYLVASLAGAAYAFIPAVRKKVDSFFEKLLNKGGS